MRFESVQTLASNDVNGNGYQFWDIFGFVFLQWKET